MRVALKFGRKVPMPSSIQIKHDLKMMAASDKLAVALQNEDCTQSELEDIVAKISGKYGVPIHVAQELSRRFERDNKSVSSNVSEWQE
jgi:hypothetical protein